MLYGKDENVLCFHGPMLYEAKVLKQEVWSAQEHGPDCGNYYFVHYKGWKQTWDEWVPESRLLKIDEASLERQRQLQSTYVQRKEERLKNTAAGSKSGADQTQKKRGRELTLDREEDFIARPEIQLNIPDALKLQLVDDWQYVTKEQRLVALPRQPTVTQLLKDFRTASMKTKKDSLTEEIVQNVLNGLKAYFDKALGTILLYRQERPQYANYLKQNPSVTSMSDVYGPEHLLRLFSQLPQLVAHTNMDEGSVSVLRDQLQLILNYMQRHAARLFMQEYENALPENLANHH